VLALVRVDEDDIYFESDNIFIKVRDFDATPAGRSYADITITVPASPVMVDDVSLGPLDTPHASRLWSLPFPPPECHNMPSVDFHDMLQGDVSDCMDSLGTFRGYDPFLDPYSLYLGGMPAKIMLTTAFHFFTDFSKASNKFKRALTIISAFLFKCFYSHASELHAQVFDKLLRALTTSELVAWILSLAGVVDAPSTSRSTILRRK